MNLENLTTTEKKEIMGPNIGELDFRLKEKQETQRAIMYCDRITNRYRTMHEQDSHDKLEDAQSYAGFVIRTIKEYRDIIPLQIREGVEKCMLHTPNLCEEQAKNLLEQTETYSKRFEKIAITEVSPV